VLLSFALLCRAARPLGPMALDALDLGGTVIACLVFVVLTRVAIPDAKEGVFAMVLTVTYTLVGRSILVPSSARRTFLLCAIVAVAVFVALSSVRFPVLGIENAHPLFAAWAGVRAVVLAGGLATLRA
jgi:hypothetical protein